MAPAGEHHLEAVVVLRVVAAGDLDAAAAAVLAARRRDVVEHRRRHRAEVDHVDPRRHQAADQRRGETGTRMPAVAADRDRPFAGGKRLAAEGATEVGREGFVDRLVDDAANVVGLEDRSVNLHRVGMEGSGKGRRIVGRGSTCRTLLPPVAPASARRGPGRGRLIGRQGAARRASPHANAAAAGNRVRYHAGRPRAGGTQSSGAMAGAAA
jgi:hypothetical protein